tara:strand:+ start:245 stop:472 length:228 start_codon:yes stop_codon:yes gene_type:complete
MVTLVVVQEFVVGLVMVVVPVLRVICLLTVWEILLLPVVAVAEEVVLIEQEHPIVLQRALPDLVNLFLLFLAQFQ